MTGFASLGDQPTQTFNESSKQMTHIFDVSFRKDFNDYNNSCEKRYDGSGYSVLFHDMEALGTGLIFIRLLSRADRLPMGVGLIDDKGHLIASVPFSDEYPYDDPASYLHHTAVLMASNNAPRS